MASGTGADTIYSFTCGGVDNTWTSQTLSAASPTATNPNSLTKIWVNNLIPGCSDYKTTATTNVPDINLVGPSGDYEGFKMECDTCSTGY